MTSRLSAAALILACAGPAAAATVSCRRRRPDVHIEKNSCRRSRRNRDRRGRFPERSGHPGKCRREGAQRLRRFRALQSVQHWRWRRDQPREQRLDVRRRPQRARAMPLPSPTAPSRSAMVRMPVPACSSSRRLISLPPPASTSPISRPAMPAPRSAWNSATSGVLFHAAERGRHGIRPPDRRAARQAQGDAATGTGRDRDALSRGRQRIAVGVACRGAGTAGARPAPRRARRPRGAGEAWRQAAMTRHARRPEPARIAPARAGSSPVYAEMHSPPRFGGTSYTFRPTSHAFRPTPNVQVVARGAQGHDFLGWGDPSPRGPTSTLRCSDRRIEVRTSSEVNSRGNS